MSDKKVRVRFAPSPTGPLHIGGMRTALFNYLFTKKNNGDFILRIEDTDQNRFVDGAEEYILESLKWVGINIDEGIGTDNNPFGPYKQSERKDIYIKYVDELLEKGHAYYAFDTSEELDEIRKKYEEEKKNFSYDMHIRHELNNSLSLPEEETQKRIKSGEAYVIRFKMPENETVIFNDIIRENVEVNTSTLDDKVLFKSDGLPTYHLANIVDDHLMEISHVIRGEEWLPSTPLHVLLYKAFGWERPEFAHMPLTLKPSGKGKLSKRDGDKLGFPVFPIEWKDPKTNEVSSGYRESGYFPEAVINILAFLGWNPGTDKEIFSMEELISEFSLERVQKAGSRFDPEKAKWYNHQYLVSTDSKVLALMFAPILKEKGFEKDSEMISKIVELVKERVNFVSEIWDQSFYFFCAPGEYDPKVVKKRWKENTPAMMQELHDLLSTENDFSSSNLETKVKSWIEEKELGMGQVMNAFRLAIVGTSMGAHMFDIVEIIGKEDTLSRIKRAISTIKR